MSVITAKGIKASMALRSPNSAMHYFKAMRALCKWATEAEHLETDPTVGIRRPTVKTEGYHTWTSEEITKFSAKWRIGSQERLAFDLILSTGLRRQDAITLGPQHIKQGSLSIKTQKTGELVTLPMRSGLLASLAASTSSGPTFLQNEHGQPWNVQRFSEWFLRACREAGCPGSPHGLRKAAAVEAAEAGMSEARLEAMFGWRGGGMAALYTRKASRARLAREAVEEMEKRK